MFSKQTLMAIFSVFFCGVMLFANANCLAGSKPNLKEGLWEITSKMEMKGMKMPAVIQKQCLTEENTVPENSQPNQECELVESSVNGDTVNWKMVCDTPEGKSNMTGEITYYGDTFKGTTRIEMQGMEMIQQISGRRIGDCKK